uniref:(northern house mosquito) hypothetical protein n=1 Tax=Culex pipiens TaxID=7175 RepID=A0A8D8A2N4_CULPI
MCKNRKNPSLEAKFTTRQSGNTTRTQASATISAASGKVMLFASRKEKVVEKDLRVCRTILDRTCGFLAGDCWAFVRRLKPRNRRELRIGGSSAATRTGRFCP